MFLNALHIRFALIGSSVVLVVVYLMFGGSLGSPEIVQIDFGMYPDLFEGCEVEIDGKIVGKLEGTGQVTRSGFKVEQGRHVIRVLHDEVGSQEIVVEVAKGEKVRVMLEMVDSYDSKSGATQAMIGAYR